MKGIERFVKTAEESGTVDDLDILLRTQPLKKVAARVSTSGKHSKFGFVFEEAKDSVDNALNKLKEKGLQLSGLHCHLGSQIKNPETYVEAIRKMLSFAVEEIPNIKKLDIGGGFPARYHENVPEISTVGAKIEKEMKYWRKKLGDIELILEPGRFLTSMAGILVSKIVNVKHMYGRKILILNVSEDMVEVERHGKIATPSVITEKEELVETSIAGNLCHSNDWISREPQMLPDAESGDIIVFENLGAYQINHNIPYNLRPLPKILTMIDGKVIENNHPFTLITNFVFGKA
ncbi:hypothetical protein AKJ39_04470 [candidate division MSBL1 archaeon SCGC-AAA259J03]|nr:hypothetical protein AKJ39_04470 [candidate division MSBL1 archaeon SCGC-AAA259J03]